MRQLPPTTTRHLVAHGRASAPVGDRAFEGRSGFRARTSMEPCGGVEELPNIHVPYVQHTQAPHAWVLDGNSPHLLGSDLPMTFLRELAKPLIMYYLPRKLYV
ncbi:hypothetical protein PIB30_059031 [Stylosanthes scabra]|uniref:Uncharacterized protein n=1 Tax=Stylosanthes scabra TaxID=79078 RepID=A0ABU6TL05_9FABA|nr:hypothetical protein [Stylosanthes scabra]